MMHINNVRGCALVAYSFSWFPPVLCNGRAKKCEKSFVDIPKETGSMTVRFWEDVFDLLFEGSAVSVTT